ncbi:beta-ketoacyl-ACP synthase 3 [Streptomyces sp. NPDC094032]|uniref:beta-ketoacyl-ACP synthase 3 n=1 Tax=Streptomyces sp. NPDC094032 TaxID=3155308 RepID=UPI00332AB95B
MLIMVPPAVGSEAAVLGVGAHRPARLVGNDEVCEVLDSSDEWIRRRSGIRSRRRAAPGETLAVMAQAACEKALAAAGVTAREVDTLLLATMSRLDEGPPVAVEVARRLGAFGATATDLSAACAGFTHGIALARQVVVSGQGRHVLVVGTERMSDIVDPRDRGTAFLFGDGAGAMVVGPSAEPGIGPVSWGSDGTGGDLIVRRGADPFLRMRGQEVFRWAVTHMPEVARAALDRAGVGVEDLDAFVPHQANLRIVDRVASALRLPDSVVVARDVVDMGNTSAASIPLAAERLLASGRVASGGLALFLGFGAGLAYAAQVVRLP